MLGNLWVADFAPRNEVEDRWVVFAEDGVQQAVFQSPPGFTLQQAEDDRVIGIFADSLNVQSIRVYRLLKDRSD